MSAFGDIVAEELRKRQQRLQKQQEEWEKQRNQRNQQKQEEQDWAQLEPQGENSYKVSFIIFPKGYTSVTDGFAIFKAKDSKGDVHTFRGSNITIKIGKTYDIKYTTDETSDYKDTRNISSITEDIDLKSVAGIRMFLEELTSKKIANAMVDKYGEQIFDILDSGDRKALKKVYGVGNVYAQKILDVYSEKKIEKDAFLALGDYGFTTYQLNLLLEHYKSVADTADVLKKNIYNIINVDGISFLTADKVALNNGYALNDYRRIVSALMYAFDYALENFGWSYMSEQQLFGVLQQLKLRDVDTYSKDGLNYMIDKGLVVYTGEKKYLSLKRIYNIEDDIRMELTRLSKCKVSQIGKRKVTQVIDDLQREGKTFSDEQEAFLRQAINNPVTVLTGSAGTGKTFTVAGLVKMVGESAYGCALSGRAASNLKDSLGDIPCSTIHKALRLGGGDGPVEEFANAKLIIVDEATMIDGYLFLQLLKSIANGTRLVIMGDIKQLPPIGNCQIYHDVLESGKYPSVTLTKIHRQGNDSNIIPFSMAVANGKSDEAIEIAKTSTDVSLHDYSDSKFVSRYFELLKENKDNLREVQTCFATRQECFKFNTMIHDILVKNGSIQNFPFITSKTTVNKKEVEFNFCVGDKVINTKNQYNINDKEGNPAACMNGEIGIVKKITDGNEDNLPVPGGNGELYMIVEFIQNNEPVEIMFNKSQYKSLELAYACTCHKLQGSGFNSVIVGLSKHTYQQMYTREWLYTAVTRAKKTVDVIADEEAYHHAVYNCETNKKQTLLKAMLTRNLDIAM